VLDACQVSKLPRSITFSRYRTPFLPADQTMYRRELFDARFQVMDESESEENETSDGQTKEGHQYIDAETDLIPGTYEGGLKTWEGGLDLVQVSAELDSQLEGGLVTWLQGKRVLEVSNGSERAPG
jgi:protein-histidine N-methyltransferase